MRHLIRFAFPLLLSALLPAAPAYAGVPPDGTGSFRWTSTMVAPTIMAGAATAAASAYLQQATQPDQMAFVQISNTERRGSVAVIVFYGWQLHYAGLVSKYASCGQRGLTLLVNGQPGVYGGNGGQVLWPAGAVVAEIPDAAPSCPAPPGSKN